MNVASLRGRFFLDTNVLVYSFDPESPDKQRRAQTLIQEALRSQRGVISTQVVQEFLSLAVRKFAHPMSVTEAREYLRSVLAPLLPSLSGDQSLRPRFARAGRNRLLVL